MQSGIPGVTDTNRGRQNACGLEPLFDAVRDRAASGVLANYNGFGQSLIGKERFIVPRSSYTDRE